MGVVHLPNMNFDHCPLWVRAGDVFVPKNSKPFTFITAWLNHGGFKQLVSHSWDRNAHYYDNITHFS